MKHPEEILRRPLLTEKVLMDQELHGRYAFEVDRRANKIEIRKAVEKKFNVKVKTVRTVVVKGKRKRMNVRRGMTFGRRATIKKAIVTLAEDHSIDLFDTGA
ncbi:MAG TPA: 50S ribosomal protein L23 [Bacteroidetes bacterium]|nr:50S ribosomal protein L23 [Bacteroidota bacterium]